MHRPPHLSPVPSSASHRSEKLLEAGLWLRMNGDPEGGLKLIEQALQVDPNNARARKLLEGQKKEAAPAPRSDPPVPTKGKKGKKNKRGAASWTPAAPTMDGAASATPSPIEVSDPLHDERAWIIDQKSTQPSAPPLPSVPEPSAAEPEPKPSVAAPATDGQTALLGPLALEAPATAPLPELPPVTALIDVQAEESAPAPPSAEATPLPLPVERDPASPPDALDAALSALPLSDAPELSTTDALALKPARGRWLMLGAIAITGAAIAAAAHFTLRRPSHPPAPAPAAAPTLPKAPPDTTLPQQVVPEKSDPVAVEPPAPPVAAPAPKPPPPVKPAKASKPPKPAPAKRTQELNRDDVLDPYGP